MIKGIKIFFKLLFLPFKLFSSTLFGRNKKTPVALKPIKYGLIFFGLLIVLGVGISLGTKGINHLDGNRYVKPYVKVADGTPLRVANPDGTVNGLNLLLIDSIQTEGYVKEYLSIVRSNYEGKLNNIKNNIPVDLVIASSINESNTYPGTPLPRSYLPWDDSSNSPLWNKSTQGLPGEALTLIQANKNVFSGTFGNGPVSPDGSADSVNWADTANGGTASQFQIALNSFPNTPLPNVNGYKESSSRKPDITYFPDQLANLSNRYNTNIKNLSEKLYKDDKYKKMVYSFNYNPGFGGVEVDVFGGNSLNSDEGKKRMDLLYEELSYIFNKYGDYLADFSDYGARKFHAAVYVPLLEERGWQLGSSKNSYAYADCGEALKHYGYKDSLDKFIQKHSSNFSLDIESKIPRTTPTLRFTKDGITIGIDGIALGHLYSKVFIGQVLYARMLKYAGVDVDPTNPSTYMNSLPEGEWTPTGNTEWMGKHGIDPKEIGPKRTSILNEAYKWIGSWYSQHNPPTPPVKDSKGEWIKDESKNGFDCSSFVQYSYKTTLKVDISRTTWSQRSSSNTYVIQASEAKPGDLIYFWGPDADWGHVAMYIGKDSNGVVEYLHSPTFGQRIGFSKWDGKPMYTLWEYRRVKGVE